MADIAVSVRKLEKRFGSFTAVNRIDFDVKKGEIFGFLGPNGAGKSTTIRMLCGIITPTSGEGRDEVFVGRIRRDESQPNSINLWIVADNLRKGAATNAVQIAAYLMNNELVTF